MKEITPFLTKITCNIILLLMAGVWAYISIKQSVIAELSPSFIALAVALVSGDVTGFIKDKFGKE